MLPRFCLDRAPRQDPYGREYPLLASPLADVYSLHIVDGLKGIRDLCEALGVFRSSAVSVLNLQIAAPLPAREHNERLMAATYPKERFLTSAFPQGTVLWMQDGNLSEYRAFLDDHNSMSNLCLFREGSSESWYVNGRARFFMCIFQTREGVEVSRFCAVSAGADSLPTHASAFRQPVSLPMPLAFARFSLQSALCHRSRLLTPFPLPGRASVSILHSAGVDDPAFRYVVAPKAWQGPSKYTFSGPRIAGWIRVVC